MLSNYEVNASILIVVIPSCKSNRKVSDVLTQLEGVKFFRYTEAGSIDSDEGRYNCSQTHVPASRHSRRHLSAATPRLVGRERCWFSKLAHVTISKGPGGHSVVAWGGTCSSWAKVIYFQVGSLYELRLHVG